MCHGVLTRLLWHGLRPALPLFSRNQGLPSASGLILELPVAQAILNSPVNMSCCIAMLAILALLADVASAQSSTARISSTASVDVQTTITGLVSASLSGIAASVVSADPCRTTLAVQCTDEDICSNALGLQVCHCVQSFKNDEISQLT